MTHPRPSRMPGCRSCRAVLPVLAALLLAGTALLTAGAGTARAEYRAYELEVVDLFDCRVNKREVCRTGRVSTALDPQQYVATHGGPYHIGVLLLATWMCHGDTSFYKPVCPRPPAKEPKFAVGDDVRIQLEKHITDGWRGTVEVAYYQHSVRSNVYGVRFPERRQVYARYYEKDLRKGAEAAAGAQGGTAQGGAAPGGVAQAPAPAVGAATPQATQPQGAPPP